MAEIDLLIYLLTILTSSIIFVITFYIREYLESRKAKKTTLEKLLYELKKNNHYLTDRKLENEKLSCEIMNFVVLSGEILKLNEEIRDEMMYLPFEINLYNKVVGVSSMNMGDKKDNAKKHIDTLIPMINEELANFKF